MATLSSVLSALRAVTSDAATTPLVVCTWVTNPSSATLDALGGGGTLDGYLTAVTDRAAGAYPGDEAWSICLALGNAAVGETLIPVGVLVAEAWLKADGARAITGMVAEATPTFTTTDTQRHALASYGFHTLQSATAGAIFAHDGSAATSANVAYLYTKLFTFRVRENLVRGITDGLSQYLGKDFPDESIVHTTVQDVLATIPAITSASTTLTADRRSHTLTIDVDAVVLRDFTFAVSVTL